MENARAYLPTVSLTLKPFGRFLPLAFGICLITRPLFARDECLLLTLPTRQWRDLIRAFALASFRWSTFGTTHFGGVNGGGGGGGGGGGDGGGGGAGGPIVTMAWPSTIVPFVSFERFSEKVPLGTKLSLWRIVRDTVRARSCGANVSVLALWC